MTWKGKRTRDPLLVSPSYRAARKYWKQFGKTADIPCGICHRPINYDAPWLLPNRRLNKRAYQLDHYPVSRSEAKRRGMTYEQINAITNTRPTHAGCNHLAGVKLGHKTHKVKAVQRKLIANTTREW